MSLPVARTRSLWISLPCPFFHWLLLRISFCKWYGCLCRSWKLLPRWTYESQKHAFALEAPLNICETYSLTALALAICCGSWWDSGPKWKRLSLVVVTGLLSWATENVMFAAATLKGIHVRNSTLTRFYSFFSAPFVVSAWVFLSLCIAISIVVWATGHSNMRRTRDTTQTTPAIGQRDNSTSSLNNTHTTWRPSNSTEEAYLKATSGMSPTGRESLMMRLLSLTTIFYLSSTLISTLFGISTQQTNWSSPTGGRALLIPRSDSSLHSLD